MNTIVSIQLFLQLNDSFIPFIQPTGQSYHDISLFQQQLLITIHLSFIFFNLLSFFFQFIQPILILFSNQLLLLLYSIPKLWSIFYFPSSDQQLTIHISDPFFQLPFLLPFYKKLPTSTFQCRHCCKLILLCLSFLLLQLTNLIQIQYILVPFLQLFP